MGMYDGAALARRRVGGVLRAWEASAALRAVVRGGDYPPPSEHPRA